MGARLLTALGCALAASTVTLDPSLQQGAVVSGVPSAEASVSVLASLDELVAMSKRVVVATALERKSQWEEVGGSRRIVTYTRLSIDDAVVGEAPSELWVRTLGGVVGRVGQAVAGEAEMKVGERGVFFLADSGRTSVVVARAQGHFRLIAGQDGELRLRPSPDAGALLPRRGPTVTAREVLLGKRLGDATELIRRVKARAPK